MCEVLGDWSSPGANAYKCALGGKESEYVELIGLVWCIGLGALVRLRIG